jgi:hypothetical protein
MYGLCIAGHILAGTEHTGTVSSEEGEGARSGSNKKKGSAIQAEPIRCLRVLQNRSFYASSCSKTRPNVAQGIF